jgi:hypothetical protein
MPARKRGRQEVDLDSSIIEPQTKNETLERLRNMWQFSALMQYIYIFGKPVKIDPDFDMEVCARLLLTLIRSLMTCQDLEHECLRPEASEKLAEIGLALLKFVSSHRGLTCVEPASHLSRMKHWLTSRLATNCSTSTPAVNLLQRHLSAIPLAQKRRQTDSPTLTSLQRSACYTNYQHGL